MERKRILGLDISLTKTGFCLADGSMLTTKGGDPKPHLDRRDTRLVRLHDDLLFALTNCTAPYDYVIIEDLPVGANGAGITAFAQGVVRLVLQQLELPMVSISPASLKKWATDDGKADKVKMHQFLPTDIQAAIPVENDDEVDAYWLWCMGHARLAGEPVPMLKKRFGKTVSVWEGWGL